MSPDDGPRQTWQWPPEDSDWRLVPKGGARRRRGSRGAAHDQQSRRRHHSAQSATWHAGHRRGTRRGRSTSPSQL
eukprot:11179697-Alexandrium_andersonii.AAC.1